MMLYQQETCYDVIEQVDALLDLHYQELTLNKDRIVLAPRWDQYAALEAAGAFVIYTARRDGDLIGYSAFFIHNHMHYAELVVAQNDVLFIHPDYRLGRTGIGLIRFCESELKKRLGSFKLTWHAKYSNDLATILDRMGYACEEMVLAKLF